MSGVGVSRSGTITAIMPAACAARIPLNEFLHRETAPGRDTKQPGGLEEQVGMRLAVSDIVARDHDGQSGAQT